MSMCRPVIQEFNCGNIWSWILIIPPCSMTLGQLLLRKLRHTRGTADLVPSAWGNARHGQGHPKQVLSDVYVCWERLKICWMTYKLNIAFPCQTILISFPVGQTYDIDVTQAGDNYTLEDCTIQIGVSMLQVWLLMLDFLWVLTTALRCRQAVGDKIMKHLKAHAEFFTLSWSKPFTPKKRLENLLLCWICSLWVHMGEKRERERVGSQQ